MKAIIPFLVIVWILVQQFEVSACSCAPSPDNFCQSLRYNEHVALVKVVSHQGEFMDVQILQSIRHGFTADTITVIGQDGLNCSEWLDQFSIGDTLILGLNDFGLTDTFNLSLCGMYFLRFNTEMVSGAISPGVNSQSYSVFISGFDQCASTSIESTSNENELSLEQNESIFTFISSKEAIKNIQIFDSLGKLMINKQNLNRTSVSLDLDELSSSLYLFLVQTESNKAVLKRHIN